MTPEGRREGGRTSRTERYWRVQERHIKAILTKKHQVLTIQGTRTQKNPSNQTKSRVLWTKELIHVKYRKKSINQNLLRDREWNSKFCLRRDHSSELWYYESLYLWYSTREQTLPRKAFQFIPRGRSRQISFPPNYLWTDRGKYYFRYQFGNQ